MKMHDPATLAFDIKLPWNNNSFITIWHIDPEKDGSDDSCGWFMRSRHGNKEILNKIEKDFKFEWNHGVPTGWFDKNGNPNYSTQAIVLGMFRIATNNVFGHWTKKADNFLKNNLYNILHFAENSCDSMYTMINQSFGKEKEEARIKQCASVIYSWILRADRPWYKHPKYHFWHWEVNIHPLQKLRRYLFSRCTVCGKGFGYGEIITSNCWNKPKNRWFEFFRSERNITHSDCAGCSIK